MAWCDRCNRVFSTKRALKQHLVDSPMHYLCYDCDIDFTSWNSLADHYKKRHHYCAACNQLFSNRSSLKSHYEYEHYYCGKCGTFFSTEAAQQKHNRRKHALYCVSCQHDFKDEHSLNTHLRFAAIHRFASFSCPGTGCHRSFTSASARTAHWESGACKSGVTRRALNRAAIMYDTQNIITNPARLIRGSDGSVHGQIIEDMWATQRSWNGRAFECFLCTRGFATLAELNAHLRSPRHEDSMYRCPRSRSGCGKEFTTLSGLCQHVESECCTVCRFQSEMENVLDSLSSKMARIAF